jgi:UDP-glucose 4-epimerase
MKVLVTGSSGFIGSAVRRELKSRGHECVPYDLPAYDVRCAGDISILAYARGVEAIINLAGMLGTPELFGHEVVAAETNILGAVNVYDVGAELGIPVVQIGTGHKGQPNPYAITKGCAEDLGLCRAQYQGEKIAVVRAYHVYGPGQPVGPPHGIARVHKFFPTFACRALTGMPLELCGGGEQLIDAVHVGDVAGVLVDAVAGPYGEVLEAGTGLALSVRDAARDIRAAAASLMLPAGEGGLPMSKIVEAEGRAGEPKNAEVVAGNPRCEHLWDYKVIDTVDWYRQWLARSSQS